MRRIPLPISVRLTLFYGLTFLLLLSGFAVFSYAGFNVALHRDFDSHLTHEQREILPFVTTDVVGPTFEGLERLTSVAYQTNGIYGTYVRLLTSDGVVRYQSPNFDDYGPLPLALPATYEATSLSRTWDGLPARTRYVPLRANDDSGSRLVGWLELTGFEWSLHRELHRLRLTLVFGVLLSVVFALAGGWWLTRRTLRPMAKMTEAARRMSAAGARGSFSARLPADFGPPDELTELAETFNGLLARLEASVARERRFTADAAHELLTPLATLRSEAEVALRRERDAPAYRESLRSLLLDVERMTDTVRGLLQLAKAESLTKQTEDRLDLTTLVADRVELVRPDAVARGLTLQKDLASGVAVSAHAAPLVEVIDNLLANAMKYTPDDGHVRVTLEHDDDDIRLLVEDTGIGFSQDEAEHLFDRFHRSDAPEVQAQSGSGLGLAIVRAIIEAYGGEVEATSAGKHKGSRFEVRLPVE